MSQSGTKKAELKKLTEAVAVTDFVSPSEFLGQIYHSAKSTFLNYSYLKFADDMGFGQTNVLRLVIAGDRVLSNKAGQRIAKALDLHGSLLRYWKCLVAHAESHDPLERERLFRLLLSYKTKSAPSVLSPLQTDYFAEWYHPIIREMVGLPDFDPDPEWIKQRLAFPLRLECIRKSLDLLVQLGVLEINPTTQKLQRNGHVTTGHEVESLTLVGYHQKMIAMGGESITRISEDLRDIQAVTVSLPLSAVPLLKAQIEAWTKSLLNLEKINEGNADSEIFQLNIQLFPFTEKG